MQVSRKISFFKIEIGLDLDINKCLFHVLGTEFCMSSSSTMYIKFLSFNTLFPTDIDHFSKTGERGGGAEGAKYPGPGLLKGARITGRGPDFSKSSASLCDEQNHPGTHGLCQNLSKKSC